MAFMILYILHHSDLLTQNAISRHAFELDTLDFEEKHSDPIILEN